MYATVLSSRDFSVRYRILRFQVLTAGRMRSIVIEVARGSYACR